MVSVDRIKAILATPRTEWPRIEAEPATIPGIVRDYLAWLAAIPALASFIGLSIVGFSALGVTVRMPFWSGLANAIVSFVLAIVMAVVMAWVASALAPRFGGRSDLVAAFKLVAYGSTAALVAGIVYLLPALSVLALLGALYSLYLVYLGVPVLLRVPQARALPCTAVLVACGIVAGIVLAVVSAVFRPSPMQLGGGDLRITTPKGEVAVDQGKLEAFAKKMEEAAKKMEAAAKSGDAAAAGNAMGAVIGALSGAGERQPIAGATLQAALPAAIGDLPRGMWETDARTAMGIAGTRAWAEYGSGSRRVRLEITDVGGLSGLMAVAGWAGALGERENQDGHEKVWKDGKRILQEKARRDGTRAEYQVVLGNGVIVSAVGNGVDLASLRRAVGGLDLDALEKTGAKG